MGEGKENLVYPSPWDVKRSLTCRKILRHATSGFASHPKEGELLIFIALNNPSSWPGSNPQPLGPVASTLTINYTTKATSDRINAMHINILSVPPSFSSKTGVSITPEGLGWIQKLGLRQGNFSKLKIFCGYLYDNFIPERYAILADHKHRWPV
jgi:hypothetical protein